MYMCMYMHMHMYMCMYRFRATRDVQSESAAQQTVNCAMQLSRAGLRDLD